jgi:hypothetical protein
VLIGIQKNSSPEKFCIFEVNARKGEPTPRTKAAHGALVHWKSTDRSADRHVSLELTSAASVAALTGGCTD